MAVEIKWHIGSGDGASKNLDRPPYRAYFFWIEEGQIVMSVDFSKDELQIEIERRMSVGEDSTEFEKAFKQI